MSQDKKHEKSREREKITPLLSFHVHSQSMAKNIRNVVLRGWLHLHLQKK